MKIVGPYTSPTIYSENPGIVELTSSDPSVASVDASVVIPGTRVWRNGLKHGQYLARANCLQARVDCAWFLEIDTNDLAFRNGGVNNDYTNIAVVQNFADGVRFTNWAILASAAKTLSGSMWFNWSFVASASSGVADVLRVFATAKQLTTHGIQRAIIQFVDSTGDLELYQTTGTVRDTRITISPKYTGTMGGTEYLVIRVPCKFAKLDSLPSQAQREAFMASGALPAGLAASYQGGHEIDPTAPVFYDTSGADPALDLSDVDVNYWPPAAASGDYTDDPLNPVVPFQPFTITPNSTGTFTITARRRRQGVPDRATDEEKYETTSETFTITEMPADVTQYVRLLITTSTPGTVDIASSDPAVVTFPSSVVVGPTLQYEVLGTVVGAGTSTITTSMGGVVLDTTTVTIEDTPTVIEAGPNQDVRTKLL